MNTWVSRLLETWFLRLGTLVRPWQLRRAACGQFQTGVLEVGSFPHTEVFTNTKRFMNRSCEESSYVPVVRSGPIFETMLCRLIEGKYVERLNVGPGPQPTESAEMFACRTSCSRPQRETKQMAQGRRVTVACVQAATTLIEGFR